MKKRSDEVKIPLCHEPWENYYILRRGIVPCCYGNEVIAPMQDWKDAWNSRPLQEIRSHLARGELSPYCLRSPSCPIVQRQLREKGLNHFLGSYGEKKKPQGLIILNRILFRIPGKIYNFLKKTK